MSHLNFSCVQIVSVLVDHTLRQRGVHLHNVYRKFFNLFKSEQLMNELFSALT